MGEEPPHYSQFAGVPGASVPGCLGTEKTEDRDQSHLVHLAVMEAMEESSPAQKKSLGVTHGGGGLSLKVFHLFLISGSGLLQAPC